MWKLRGQRDNFWLITTAYAYGRTVYGIILFYSVTLKDKKKFKFSEDKNKSGAKNQNFKGRTSQLALFRSNFSDVSARLDD